MPEPEVVPRSRLVSASESGRAPTAGETYDDVVADLRQLRGRQGEPSYARIAQRIAQARVARGVEEFAALPARTTIYDAFKLGRARLDSTLVGEIAHALGEDETGVARWVDRVEAAGSARRARSDLLDGVLAEDPGGAAATVSPASGESPGSDGPPRREASAGESGAAGAPGWRLPERPWSTRRKAVLLLACVALNVLGHAFVAHLPLTLYLDMVGTAIAAIALGPAAGIAVAVSSQSAGVLVNSPETLAFLPVNVVGALVWGYGARRWRRSGSVTSFFALNLVVGVACTLIATAILVALYPQGTGHGGEPLVLSFEALGEPLPLSIFSANLVTSVVDKLIAGFIALAVLASASLPSPRRPVGDVGHPRPPSTLEPDEGPATSAAV